MNILKKVLSEIKITDKSAYGSTDVGQQRETNEDCYLVLPSKGIYIVADGMGGHNAGEVASLNAVKSIGKYFTSQCVSDMRAGKRIEDKLAYAVLMAHEQIKAMSGAKAEYSGMGSTIAVSFIHKNILHTCHVGDSRVYVINSAGITQITRDHSTVGEMVRTGELTKEEARHSSLKNEVTQALGVSLTRGPEYNRTYELNEGDMVLICSDGLWDMLSDEEIQSIVMEGDGLKETCNELVHQANEAGGEDNITVVLVRINENGL
jgi:protein phosphatase